MVHVPEGWREREREREWERERERGRRGKDENTGEREMDFWLANIPDCRQATTAPQDLVAHEHQIPTELTSAAAPPMQ